MNVLGKIQEVVGNGIDALVVIGYQIAVAVVAIVP